MLSKIPNLNHKIFKGVNNFESINPKNKKRSDKISSILFTSLFL